MKLLHFATDDIRGGASKVSYQMHDFMRRAGHTSHMIVRNRYTHEDPDVVEAQISSPLHRLNRLKRCFPCLDGKQYHTTYHGFNMDTRPPISESSLRIFNPDDVDLLCFHWISGFITARMIRRIQQYYCAPILLTLHDREAMTGGCHYQFGCKGYERRCGNCPQLIPSSENDWSRVVWRRKAEAFADLPIAVCVGTTSTVEMVRKSSLLGKCPVTVVPGLVDETVFRPFDKRASRDLLHLPASDRIVLVGANTIGDRRKGMSFFVEAMKLFRAGQQAAGETGHNVFILVAGLEGEKLLKTVPFPGLALGLLHDETTLALAYQAADVFVCTSIDDEGPIMIPQAMMCGTPVVSFPTGLAVDLIQNMRTGYLCSAADADELTVGLERILGSPDFESICHRARDIAASRHSREVFLSNFLSMCETVSTNSGDYCAV